MTSPKIDQFDGSTFKMHAGLTESVRDHACDRNIESVRFQKKNLFTKIFSICFTIYDINENKGKQNFQKYTNRLAFSAENFQCKMNKYYS